MALLTNQLYKEVMKNRLKIIFITAFCLTSIYAGAQSQRKINEQLKAELIVSKSKYDSIAALASKTATQLLIKQVDFRAAQRRNYLREQTNLDALLLKKSSQLLDKKFDLEAAHRRSYQLQEPDPVYTILSKKVSPIEQTDLAESRLWNQVPGISLTSALEKVETHYNQLLRLGSEPSKLLNLTDLKTEIVRFQEKLPAAELPKEMLEQQKIVLLDDTLFVKEGKRKVQNEWLRGQLSRYSLAIEENTTKIRQMNAYSEVIDRTRPVLDSVYLNYEKVLYDLAVGEAILRDSIHKLREFSLTNWPKNFSKVYEQEFGTPERQEISQPTGEGWSTHVWYAYSEPFGLTLDFIKYANPIPINEFSVEAMRNQGQVNMFRPDPSIVYSYVDEPAEFPGGMKALMKYIQNNFRIPQVVEDLGLSFKLRMKFTVLEDGSITDITVSKGISECPECDKEALRVIKNMPKWKPGKLQGKVVKSWYSLPIQIHLN